MGRVEKSIELDVPVSTVYNQWTQFEDFPKFMQGVQEVRQLDDSHLYWSAEIGGHQKQWYASITQQEPDSVIAWESEGGARNYGMVRFEELSAGRCRITLTIEYDPEGIGENIGDALGLVDRQVAGDLERFCDFIEGRQVETGAWRGKV